MERARQSTGLASLALVGICAALTGAARPAGAQTPVPTPTPSPTPTPAPTFPTFPTPLPFPNGNPLGANGTPTTPNSNGTTTPPGTTAVSQTKKGRVPPGQLPQKLGVDSNHVPLSQRLFGKWGRDLNISGNISTRVQNNSVSGASGGTALFSDYTANQNYAYRNTGPFQQNASVYINGRLFNAFDVDATLSNQRGATNFNQVFRFNFERNGTKIALGNITGTLPGNEYVTFTRTLQGIGVDRDFGKGRIKFKGIASLTRSVTKRGSVQGTGSDGPYFMNAANIIPGSEKVYLDDRELKPEEYKIDYYQGTLTLQNGLIATQANTLSFTYETQNYNTTPGLLTGMRWDFLDPRGNQYGITYLQQKSIGNKNRNGDVTEYFPVSADPQNKYQLSNLIDTTRPVVVQWYNRILIENVDYVLNKELRYFQLLTDSLPPDTSVTGTASLKVTYHPLQQASIGGDRSVLGLDTLMRVLPNATVGINLGQSDGINPAQRGQALTVRTTLTSPRRSGDSSWQVSLGWKDMDSTFSTIESTAAAFQQARRGLTLDGGYRPNKFITYTFGMEDGRVANQDYSTLGSTASATPSIIWSRQQSFKAGAAFNFPHMPQFTLSHQQSNQNSGGTSNSKSTYARTGLDASWNLDKRVKLSGGLDHTVSQGRSIFATAYNNSVANNGNLTGGTIIDQLQNSATSLTNTTSDNARLSLGYIPYEWLTLNSQIGLARSQNGASLSGTQSSASASLQRTMGFSFTASPFQRYVRLQRYGLHTLSLNGSYSESANGQSTANFYNPGSSGSGSIIPTNTSGQQNHTTTWGIHYAPHYRFQMDYSTTRQLALIPGYDNTRTAGNTISLIVSPFTRPFNWLTTTIMHTTLISTYVGGQGNSNSTNTSIGNAIGPFGRMTIRTAYYLQRYDSATYLSNGSGSVIGTRQVTVPTYGGTTGGSTTGVLQQGTTTTWALDMDYRLSELHTLTLGWNAVDQRSPLAAGSSVAGATYASNNTTRGQGTIGLRFNLQKYTGLDSDFSINFNITSLKDRDNPSYSYRARTFYAEFGTRFN